MNEHSISVIIPVYNVGGVLRRCLDSVINQTWRDLEIVLIDDGSTDESPKICDEYAMLDSRIRVIHQKNKGVSAARNVGVKQSTGEYISFVDSDDYLHPRYFEILVKVAEKQGAEVSCCKWTWDVCDNPKTFPEVKLYGCETMSAEEAFRSGKIEKGPYCKIVKRTALGMTEFNENLSFLEDSIYTKTLLLNGLIQKVVFTPLMLYYYYQRPTSASHTKHADERMPALKYSFAQISTYRDMKKQYLWTESTIKLLCSTRDIARKEKDGDTIVQCNEMARKLKSMVWKYRDLTLLKKTILTLFTASEFIYATTINVKMQLRKLKEKISK